MQTLDEKPETIHLYVVRETEPKPPILPIVLSALSLIVLLAYCVLTPYQQPEVRTIIRVPAAPSLIKIFSSSIKIVPTGIKTYPATTAHGTLTITNGSIISQTLPVGFTSVSRNSISVVTDEAVFVPAGNANGYGISTVPAHLLTSGINMSTLSINQVVGTSLYVRNLQPFTGGRPAYSVKVVTLQDRQTALIKAGQQLAIVAVGLHYPCQEIQILRTPVKIAVTWSCQFVTYSVPSYMHILGTQLRGKEVLVAVWFIAPVRRSWAK